MNTVTWRRFVRWYEWYKFQPEVNDKQKNDTGNFIGMEHSKFGGVIDFHRDTDSFGHR